MHVIYRLLSLVLFISIGHHLLSQNKRFFDFNEGLSNSLINDIHQDHLGFIWVATEDGLNRFDGIRFTHFNSDKNQIKTNYTTNVVEDKEGNLWVGLVNGLLKYDHKTESFNEIAIHINDKQIHPFVTDILIAKNGDIWLTTSGYGLVHIEEELGRPRYSTRFNNRFSSLHMRTLFEDNSGAIWIGSDDSGIDYYNPFTDEIKHINAIDGNSALSNEISSICQAPNQDIYIGSLKNGLTRINPKTFKAEKITSSNTLTIKTLFIDSKNRLLIGTDGMGLKQYNLDTNVLDDYSHNSSPFDFSKSKVHSIIEDKSGNIWVGIFQKGLFLIPEAKTLFTNYGYKAFGTNSIGSSCVTALAGDKSHVWIGTDGDGLYQYNRKTEAINKIPLKRDIASLKPYNIFSFNSSENILWIGTYSNGLIKFDKNTHKTSFYKNDPNDSKSLPNDIITCIKNGNNNDLWLSTFGAGVVRFDTDNDIFETKLPISDSLNTLIPKWVNDIYIDKQNNFWVGSYDGLILAQPDSTDLVYFNLQNGKLPNNVVYCIYPDDSGNIWVGTYGGLVKISLETHECITYTTKDGLASNVICAIESDEFDQIWLSTHNGLSRLNPKTKTFINYYASDGLQSNEFSRKVVLKTEDRQLMFGGINGVTVIKKHYNSFKYRAPDVIITAFNIFNKPVNIGDKSGNKTILSQSIILSDSINLAEHDNIFSIEFTSVELANQSSINYEYKMVGFDNAWTTSNAINRSATYTNLGQGTYTFIVRSKNKDNYSTPRELTIIIHPPWYKTTWAKILWFLIASVLLLAYVKLYKDRFRHIEAEKLNDKKTQFFINISHEIRTPLSLIIDPLDKLLSQKNDSETSRLYNLMQQNSNRILKLINQLLDVQKLDKSQMLVKYQKTKLNQYISNIAGAYNYMVSSKDIDFSIEDNSENVDVWIDPLNFEKVIVNLLSNAFKFTPNKGIIKIVIATKNINKEEYAVVSFIDNGIGIKKHELELVFNRFYQVDSAETRNNTGTGIGLHLSKSIVELHKGRLYAEQNTGQVGTQFILEIPIGNAHLPKKDLIIDENIMPLPMAKAELKPTTNSKEAKKPKSNIKIAIVEDEVDIRNYLVNELSEQYTVLAYENGQQAYMNIFNDKPNLIVSDIMMPEMDGITFCKKVKNHIDTNHIPIILLTALSKEENRSEGIETGADMYMVKPFNSSFLKKSIKNLLENRKRVSAKLKNKEDYTKVDAPEVQSHNEILMQKVMSIIKDNLSNNELNVEMLADNIGISRVHLHRKLKEITNQSARDIIKNIRMKQASYILTTKKINVSEVAYSLGFSSLSHFSTSFKAYYGVSPKEYIELQNNPDKEQADELI